MYLCRPPEFSKDATATPEAAEPEDPAGAAAGDDGDDSSDDGLPPLQPNTNRHVYEYSVSEDSSDED